VTITLRRDDAFLLHERSAWHPNPVVLNSSGNPRPPLPVPCTIFLQHHAGAGRWDDTGDFLLELLGVERWAASVGKPNEYNSAVAPTEQIGAIYAGPFQAAHCAGWNDDPVWGNLALWNGVLEDPADPLLYNIIQLRHRLVERGWLTPDHLVMPHREAPCGQATGTSCPTDLAELPYWPIISAPLDFTPKPKPSPVFDPWQGSYGTMVTADKSNIRRADEGATVEYAKAIIAMKLPPFLTWYEAVSLRKAGAAKRTVWRDFHNAEAMKMRKARTAATALAAHKDGRYGGGMVDAVDLIKIALNGRKFEGGRLDFSGGGDVIGGEVFRFLDGISDGIW